MAGENTVPTPLLWMIVRLPILSMTMHCCACSNVSRMPSTPMALFQRVAMVFGLNIFVMKRGRGLPIQTLPGTIKEAVMYKALILLASVLISAGTLAQSGDPANGKAVYEHWCSPC